MPSESVPDSFNDIPASVVRRWAMKAGLLGLFVGAAAAIVALAT